MKPRDDLPGGVDDADGRPGRLQLCPAAQTDDNPVEDGDPRIIQHARFRVEIENPAAGDEQIAR